MLPNPKKFLAESTANLVYSLYLWSSGQSSWLQIERFLFDSRRYHIIWEVVGLERGPLSLVSTIEELLERKSSGSGQENRDYGRRDPSRWPLGTIYTQKLALTSLTSCGVSVGIVRSRTPVMEFVLFWCNRKKSGGGKRGFGNWEC
jgi:hypothetical protein